MVRPRAALFQKHHRTLCLPAAARESNHARARALPAGQRLLPPIRLIGTARAPPAGERCNDDFFVHYGFVPPRNPHDDVALFSGAHARSDVAAPPLAPCFQHPSTCCAACKTRQLDSLRRAAPASAAPAADIEAAIDWWLAAFLPAGALPPQRLQLAIAAAYEAAEQQDSSAQAAEAVLSAVPEAEAEVIRSELARIKLAAGGMADGRLLAAFRSLHEAASSAASGTAASPPPGGSQEAGSGGCGAAAALGGDWRRHVQAAVGRRAVELLRGMPTPLLSDLERLAAWEQETGQQQHGWEAVRGHYAAALTAYEARHGSLLGEAGESGERNTAQAAADTAPLLDAGAADADLARLLLQQAPAAARQASGGATAEEDSGGADDGGSVGGGTAGSILPVLYRCYKKLILADAVLLSAD